MNDSPDDLERRQALQIALARMESFQNCEALLRQQATLLNRSIELHRQATQCFAESYKAALPALDEATIETLRQHNDDVMAFMQQAQQQSLQSVEQLQAIVSRLVADIEAAQADAEP